MSVAVIGAGGWGTALSVVAARAGQGVKLWSRSAAVVEEINRERTNGAYLAGHEIPANVRATCDAEEVLRGAELVILAAPSHATRAVVENLSGHARPEMI